MTGAIETAVRARLAPRGARTEHGIEVLEVEPATAREALRFLRDEPGLAFTMLLDITATDGLQLGWPDRFRVAYTLYSIARNERVRVVASVPEDGPGIPSVHDLWKNANWLERETWDQYGVVFTGHPNLVRILNHKDFVGHPLRKDYDIKKGQWLAEPDDLMGELEKARRGLLPDY
jgi:NADH/F420H2 dehydrogenase subunit C